MEIIRGIHNLKQRHQICVVTIGNFDGLHLGHQLLLKRLMLIGEQFQLPTLAIIFEPQPNEFFSQEKNIPRLMRFREKIEGLSEAGIDRVLCIKFNKSFAGLTAEEFVRKILVEKLTAKYVLVGDDFRFGYKRMGDYSLLNAEGKKYHFHTECMPTFELLGERVSSTRIRKLLEVGEMEKSRELLNHYFGMKGKIAHGDKRGRLIGCPTANIHLHRKVVPISGVFAVEMLGIQTHPLPGVANVGTRPTLAGDTRTILEVHLLDFNEDIYGKKVEVRFLHKFRDEKKFSSFDELKEQIQKDIQQARRHHLNKKSPPSLLPQAGEG